MAKVADVVIVCMAVLVLDIIAGLLGILAHARRNKNCDGPGYRLGVAASVLFVAAHASSNLDGACDCICPQLKEVRDSMSKRKLNATIAYLSLAVFAVGALLLIAGTKWCKFIHGQAVGIGAIMCFVHGGIIIAYYAPAIFGCREAGEQHP